MSADDRLQDLAGKILDGSPIDWQADTAGLDEEAIEELRALAAVALIHRDLARAPLQGSVDARRTPGPLGAWGSLHLIERIGGGAFGEVYRAWDSRLDREVALKLLHPSASPQHDQGVITEGRLLARIRHPAVVTVHGAEVIDGRVGIWTEFVPGRTLTAIVQHSGPLSADTAIAIGLDLCRALGAIHAAGLVHGDVKAQNVLQQPDGRVVLVDFGTGREQVHEVFSSPSRRLSGTPLYMAPELWHSHEPTPSSDVYSLGVLLYYLVSGTHPVRGNTADEVRDAHARGERVQLRDARSGLPAGFVAAVERALDPDPSTRFRTADQLLAALERSAPAAVRRRRARMTWVLASAAAIITLLVLGWSGAIRWPSSVGRPMIRVEQLTFQPPETPVLAAAISSSGEHLAYADLTGLFIRTIATREILRVSLPESFGAITDVAWIADSNELIVATAQSLWRISAFGSARRQITAMGGLGLFSISPDGRHLAIKVGDSSGSRIYVMTTDGEKPKEVVRAVTDQDVGRPTWAPGGVRIAYARTWNEPRFRRAVESCLTEGGGTTTILDFGVSSLVWAPDGRLMYSRTQSGGDRYTDLWQIHVDPATGLARGEPSRLDHQADLNFNRAHLTPDGTRLVFIVNKHTSRVFVGDFDATGPWLNALRQAVFTNINDQPVAWMPTGDTIVFRTSNFAMMRQPFDRPEPVRLLPPSARTGDWAGISPDGRWVFYASASEPWRLVRHATGGGEAERLFDLTTGSVGIKCSLPPANLCVVGQHQQQQSTQVQRTALSTFDPRGGSLISGATINTYEKGWDLTADGAAIVYIDSSIPGRLQIVDVATDRQSSIDSPSLRGATFVVWTRDSSGWIVSKPVRQRGGEVLHVDRAGRVTLLWKSNHMRLMLPTVSPDGRRIAFGAWWVESNVAMMRGF